MEHEERRKELLERFKKLRSEAKEDSLFQKATLDKHFDSTIKIASWIDKRQQWNQLGRSYEYKRLEAWKKAYEYYRTDYPVKLDNKEEYKNMIATDPSYSEVAGLAHLVSDIVDFIDATIKNLQDRKWEIQSLADYIKFLHGK